MQYAEARTGPEPTNEQPNTLKKEIILITVDVGNGLRCSARISGASVGSLRSHTEEVPHFAMTDVKTSLHHHDTCLERL
jgi:hypothetical protein